MIGELALTPSIFYKGGYLEPNTGRLYLQALKEPLLQESLVRDLYDGAWHETIQQSQDLSNFGKEFLAKLRKQGRLRMSQACMVECPVKDDEWCQEAMESHRREPLDCIITTHETKASFAGAQETVSIEKLYSHPWWSNRGPSVRLKRTTAQYLQTLRRLLVSSNSLMFIDPHLDPSKERYAEFIQILLTCRVNSFVRIELHRACYKKMASEVREWEQVFRDLLEPALAGSGLRIEVFFWDDMHDRYIISNLMGIQCANGFDTSKRVANTTTWSRLSRKNRDEIQREFDSDASPHVFRGKFTLKTS